MKRIRGIAACALALSIAAPSVRAQIPTPTIGAGGGAAFPLGNNRDFYSTGYNVLVYGGIDFGLIPLGVRVDGALAHFSPQGFSGHDNVWSGTANLVYKIHAPIVQPYVIGGVGYYYTNVDASSSGSKFGVNGGVGLTLRIPALFGVFGELRYHYIANAGHAIQYVPLTFGITL
jgi:Outer membrane protein beta-barrel domain